MSDRPQYSTKRDANQAEIRAGLEHLGFVVFDVSQLAHLGCDLLVVGYHGEVYRPMVLMVEVKTENGTLTDREREVRDLLFYKMGEQSPWIEARDVMDVLEWFSR